MTLAPLFHDHLLRRRQDAEAALARTGFETLVIGSGVPFTHFADDQDAPFRSTPHFLHWCPMAGPRHLLKVQPGRRPRLLRYAPEDFWYEQASLEEQWDGRPYWLDEFDLEECPSPEAVWAALGPCPKGAFLGDDLEAAGRAGLALNPDNLTKHLDWTRSFKSPYELELMIEAQRLGALGHEAAKQAFFEGASEIEIHHAYVRTLGCTDADLPYGSIVALNEKGATLHYEGKRPHVRGGAVLLIDIGAKFRGYASDITRTYAAPHCDPRFKALLEGMERLQQELCAQVRPGLHYGDFHQEAHFKIADLLLQEGLLRNTNRDEAVKLGLTKPFFPHGLGHHLGIQVHDVAGKQLGPDGAPAPQPPEHPFLRTTRMIEEGHVFTVEPGLYFIPLLLRPFRSGADAAKFHWDLIDALTPLGGIRIEDNVLVTATGHRNLTREHLPH